MPSWPLTLPQKPLLHGYRENKPKTVVRTEMDQGPAKVRRRSSAGVTLLETVWLLNAAQLAALDAFFDVTIAGGAVAFDFAHPRTGGNILCRMTAPPEYRSVNGSACHVTIMMEVLP